MTSNFFFHNNIEFLILGKCYFCYRCERIFWGRADVSQFKMLQTLQKFLLFKHLHLKLQCHTNAQHLVAHGSHCHSLLVAMENNCSVCCHPNTKYSCIVCAVTICNVCSWLRQKKDLSDDKWSRGKFLLAKSELWTENKHWFEKHKWLQTPKSSVLDW